MGRRPTPEARRRKRARYAANAAARQDGSSPPDVSRLAPTAEPATRPSKPASTTGRYDASHLRPTKDNPDPGLIAAPHESWQHMLPLLNGGRRRYRLADVQVHHRYGARRPRWMGEAA